MKDKAFSIGVDCGSATIKAAVLADGAVAKTRAVRHHGDVTQAAQKLLTELAQAWPQAPVVLTGSMGGRLQENCPSLAALDEIPALQQGIAYGPRRRARSSRWAVKAHVFSQDWAAARRRALR